VDILGRRWTHLVLQALTGGPRQFSQLAVVLSAVSERMLSARLKELVAEGIVERRVVPDTPVSVNYRLTPKGEALGAVLDAIGTWADRWVESSGAPPAHAAPHEGASRPAKAPSRPGASARKASARARSRSQ
jgi:DNA-binding HxlR family transcriptional regulator